MSVSWEKYQEAGELDNDLSGTKFEKGRILFSIMDYINFMFVVWYEFMDLIADYTKLFQ